MEKKWITGYEGLYEITTNGTVIRHHKAHIKELVGAQNSAGYCVVGLSKKGVAIQHLVHRLVAEYFIPNPEGKEMVDHIDEDKTNNSISNLRWCSAKENAEFYCTKDGRAHQLELARKRKELLKMYSLKLQALKWELNRKNKELQLKEKELALKVLENDKLVADLEKSKKALAKFIHNEVTRLATPTYEGWADTTGMKFKSVDDLVNITGKPITVSGIQFNSCGAAAAYIVAEELKLGTVRNRGTISKELRRYLQGKRNQWAMYDRYYIA